MPSFWFRMSLKILGIFFFFILSDISDRIVVPFGFLCCLGKLAGNWSRKHPISFASSSDFLITILKF